MTFLHVIKYFRGHTFSWLHNILLYEGLEGGHVG